MGVIKALRPGESSPVSCGPGRKEQRERNKAVYEEDVRKQKEAETEPAPTPPDQEPTTP